MFIEESGPAGLTMRGLGQRLGVEAMSLYRYVPDKNTLLDLVAQSILDGLAADTELSIEEARGWQPFLRQLAHGVRRVALRHPNTFPLLLSHPAGPAGLRAPLRDPHWAEVVHATLISDNFSDQSARVAYRAFSSFLLGELIPEVTAADAAGVNAFVLGNDPPHHRGGNRGRKPAPWFPYPTLLRLQHGASPRDPAKEFDEVLDVLLGVLSAYRSSQDPPAPAPA